MGVKFGIEAKGDPGTTAPLPEITRVEVREQLGEMITYTLVFAEDICDDDFQVLKHPSLMPCKEISIWVEVNGKNVYLARGPVQGQQIKIVKGGQGSDVQIRGSDNSVKMKLVERKENHKNQKDSEIVSEILKKYGFTNQAVKNFGLENDEAKHSKLQNQDDLSFLKSIAQDQGLYFWISYDDLGSEVAHFDELPLESSPAETLIVNSADETKVNIDELSISWDSDVPTKVVGSQLETKKKNKTDANVERSEQHKLGVATLDLVTKECRQEGKSSPKPADDVGRVQQRSKGALNEAEWFIKASCSTSFDRLCKVIHAHTIVEVIGAGSRHSGKYLISGVTHTIDSASYKMQLELMRNAWD